MKEGINMAMIYCVEDDKSIREIEMYTLQSTGFETKGFEDGYSFFEELKEEKPDLILLDVMLPDEDGYEIVKKLRQNPATKKLPVIMVTAKTSEIDMVRGLDIGADDYIKKPFSIIEFITRVKAVLRRTLEQPDDKYMTIGDIFLDNERHVVYVDNKGIELTYKEYELLKLLMHNAGIVLTREKIMERVWDTEFEGESRTVDMHIKTLRKKLGDSSRHIKTVRNVGYVME